MIGPDLAIVAAYLQIVLINVALSGDNAIVIGMAAAGLRPDVRGKAILAGIGSATVIRIVFAIAASQLMAVTGLLLAGGLLLLWVCWKMYCDLREPDDADTDGAVATHGREKTLSQAVVQIVIADVSMSLDNVLAVAGAARTNIFALVFGLILSVLLMGLAASLIARLLTRFHWIAWVGLAIIAYVALAMVYSGADQVVGGWLPNLPLLSA
jgi:YjbE family integral membrane protein